MKLRAMDAADAARYLAASLRSYAADIAQATGIPLEEASTRAQKQVENILPQNTATAGHDFMHLLDDDGTRAGALWLAAMGDDLYIYDIFIEPDRRGGGRGTATMLEVERIARERGATGVLLSVFTHNDGAVRLYDRLGYTVTKSGPGGIG